MARILILGAKVPFTSGGQEVLVRTLSKKISEIGHEVDIFELGNIVHHKRDLMKMAMLWRSIDFTKIGSKEVDLVIATKFPTYFINHPNKSLWLVHQHRPMYELYGSNYSDFSDSLEDNERREALVSADTEMIKECKYLSAISKNVADRLQSLNGIKAEVLYPPLPMGSRYYNAESEDYILSVARLCRIKRIDLIIEALAKVEPHVKLKIVGMPDEYGVEEWLNNLVKAHGLQNRVEFLGRVSDEQLLDLYAKAKIVYYAPFDEDYGYVTLEAFASGKPIVTANDSGGVLEFAKDNETAVVGESTPSSLAECCNRIIKDSELEKRLSKNGLELISDLKLAEAGWDKVVNGLLSPLK